MRRWFGTVAVLAALTAGWQALALGGSIASPGATLLRLNVLMGMASFWADIAATGRAFALAVVLSAAGGLGLAALLGRRLAAAVAEPILVTFYALPKVTLYPLVLLVFGLGIEAKVAFGVMHGLIPLTLLTLNAMRQVPRVFLRTAAVMRLSQWQTLRTIILPAILPEVLVGLRLCVSLSLLGVLIGEMFASTSGLGHRVMAAMEAGDMASVLAVAVLLAGFALVLNHILSPARSAATTGGV